MIIFKLKDLKDGGFLQIGTANAGSGDPTSLLAETSFKAIVIKPAFRLNIFGFLASKELLTEPTNTGRTVGNLGFWDLRLALEWTHKNISYFSGNPSNITIGGYSAGAHAAFYQLAYDMESPPEKRIVKRIIMHSQGPGVQPRSLEEVQLQFDELLEVLNIPQSLSSKEKLRRLRAMSTRTLLAAIPMRKMRYHQFRAVTDGVFVRNTLFKDIITGDFARRMLESNICLLTGECSDEHFVYGRYRAPADDYNSVVTRLVADYPKKNVGALAKHYFPGEKLPQEHKRWKEAFGKVYADVQIHATQRGFVDGIIRGGAGKLVHRYRIEWRSKLADRSWPREWGATHGADQIIWFWGNGRELDDGEKAIIKDAFIEQFAAFIKGDAVEWGTDDPHRVRRLSADGTVDICRDEFRDEKLKVWHALQDATFKPFEPKASL